MFSIVIPTYQRDKDLEECLASIRATSTLPVEIIVLHGPSDNTDAICKKYDARSVPDNARKDGRRVKSLWAIINDGVRQAKYDLVMYLNDDCLLLPGWDKICVSYFTDDKTGLLVCKTKGIGQDPSFRIVYGIEGFPCANYGVINKKAGILFDESFSWYYGDADLPLQFYTNSSFEVKCSNENLIIHNHKIDENRKEHDSLPDEQNPDHIHFINKWSNYKRKGDRFIKKNFFDKFKHFIKEHI